MPREDEGTGSLDEMSAAGVFARAESCGIVPRLTRLRDVAGTMMNEVTGAAAPAIDPVWLSETIGSIYDCVLNPTGWQAVLRTITEELAFAAGTLSVVRMGDYAHRMMVGYNIDDDWVASMDRYGADAVELWGGAERIAAFPLDEPVMSSEVRSPEEWPRFAYYRDILKPRGMIDGVVVNLLRDQRTYGYVGFPRNESAGPIRPADIEGLRLLAPHLRRAVTISNLFDLKAVESATFRSVLDAMTCAVVLVDADLGIVHANQAARRLFDERDLMRSHDSRLLVGGRVADGALRAAVAQAAANEAYLSQRGIGIPATGYSGAPAALHVLPLARRAGWPDLGTRAVAAVFVVTGAVHAPVDFVAELYALTPAESQILASLCQGRTITETADALGIALNTAKTHLKRIFSKIGCSRQAEAVALVAKFGIGF